MSCVCTSLLLVDGGRSSVKLLYCSFFFSAAIFSPFFTWCIDLVKNKHRSHLMLQNHCFNQTLLLCEGWALVKSCLQYLSGNVCNGNLSGREKSYR